MSVGREQGIVGGVRIDLKRLHETWMELVYPRQRDADQTVLGKWKPNTQTGMILYRIWSYVGVPVIALLYPLVLLGTIVRFQTRRIDETAMSIGLIGVILLSVVVWGTLTLLARFQLDLAAGGLLAVGSASVIATVAAALAVFTRQRTGRAGTVLIAYPFAMTAIFLPPVVAALFSNSLAATILPFSDRVGRFLLWDVLQPLGAAEFFADNFDREGGAHAVMWFAISVPAGWLLGLLVSLADLVRPTT